MHHEFCRSILPVDSANTSLDKHDGYYVSFWKIEYAFFRQIPSTGDLHNYSASINSNLLKGKHLVRVSGVINLIIYRGNGRRSIPLNFSNNQNGLRAANFMGIYSRIVSRERKGLVLEL